MIVVKCPKCGSELIDVISYNFDSDGIRCPICDARIYVKIKTTTKKEIRVSLSSVDVCQQEPVTIIF